ncbi:hypothetical protein OAG24_00975 [bacterium]|nr:hypothetical protein [bacterium]
MVSFKAKIPNTNRSGNLTKVTYHKARNGRYYVTGYIGTRKLSTFITDAKARSVGVSKFKLKTGARKTTRSRGRSRSRSRSRSPKRKKSSPRCKRLTKKFSAKCDKWEDNMTKSLSYSYSPYITLEDRIKACRATPGRKWRASTKRCVKKSPAKRRGRSRSRSRSRSKSPARRKTTTRRKSPARRKTTTRRKSPARRKTTTRRKSPARRKTTTRR